MEQMRNDESYMRGPCPVPTPMARERVAKVIADMRTMLREGKTEIQAPHTTEELEALLKKFLVHNKGAIHPGKGRQDAQLIREVSDALSLHEDLFLPDFVVRDKERWGLK